MNENFGDRYSYCQERYDLLDCAFRISTGKNDSKINEALLSRRRFGKASFVWILWYNSVKEVVE